MVMVTKKERKKKKAKRRKRAMMWSLVKLKDGKEKGGGRM